jgi:hypothetical protein
LAARADRELAARTWSKTAQAFQKIIHETAGS